MFNFFILPLFLRCGEGKLVPFRLKLLVTEVVFSSSSLFFDLHLSFVLYMFLYFFGNSSVGGVDVVAKKSRNLMLCDLRSLLGGSVVCEAVAAGRDVVSFS